MVSHRVADNRLDVLKDDLSLALQRIRHNLDTYQKDPAEPAPLEAMIDALDQIRGPLVALDHRKAVALLDEMRLLTLGLVKGELHASNPMALRQAAELLAGYLESCLSPGQRWPDADLAKMIDALRQARQQDVPVVAGDDGVPQAVPESSATPYAVLDTLKRLQQTVAVDVENAIDQPEAWGSLRDELQTIRRMLAGRDWMHATSMFERLERVAGALATGADYGPLATGMFAEMLAALGHHLEQLDGDQPAPAIVLNAAEEHLAQLETLLKLPAAAESSPAATALTVSLALEPIAEPAFSPTPVPTASESPDARAPAAAWPLVEQDVAAPDDDAIAVDWPEPDLAESLAFVAGSPSPEAEEAIDLVSFMGLSDADPEFVDVFLEEARGELIAIRDQLECWRKNLADRQAVTAIRRAFHTLKGSGRMVGATVIGDFAWEFENLLNQVLSGSLTGSSVIADAIAEAVAALAPLVGEVPLRGGELDALPALVTRAKALTQAEEEPVTLPSIRVEPAPAAPVPTAPPVRVEPPAIEMAMGIDPEFLEVFQEEAHGELDNIRAQQAIWQRNLADRQAMTVIRRAFHTLKGSGRVVGATVIGDFSWEFENLLSQVLSGTLTASPEVAGLIGEAATALEPLIDKMPADGEAMMALESLVSRARVLLQAAQAGIAAPSVQPSEPAKPIQIEAPAPSGSVPLADVAPAAVPEPVALSEADLELAQVFQYEATEILDASDLILQQLATEADHAVLLNDLRRNMHTLKGSSRMSGFMTVGDLAHAAESVLDALGKGAGHASPVVLDTLQHTLDRLNRMLAEAASGANPAAATDLIDDLHRLADTLVAGEPVVSRPAPIVSRPAEPISARQRPAEPISARQRPAEPISARQRPAEPISARQRPATAPEPGAFQAMTELDQELVQVFQTEAGEILDSSDVIIQRLRSQPDSVELLNDLRREMHTLKGSSRMAGFMTIGELAHAAESILDALGKGTLKGSSLILDHIQRALDRLHQMLAGVLNGVQPSAQKDLIDELHGVLGARPAERSKPMLPAMPAPVAVTPAARPAEKPVAAAAAAADSIRVSAALLNALVNQMGESSIFRARIDQGVGAMSFNLNELEQTIVRLRRQVTNLATQAESRIQSRQDQGVKAHQQEFDPLELDRFTELQQVSRSLMEIADDLGNIGNTLGDHAREITSLLDQQGKVNKEIQQGLMRTGMVRFGTIVPRLRRVVRQSAQELGKRAELLVGGEDAEVDRNVLENMVAPLEHMLRNSLAHGVEAPEQRRLAGKPEIGTISLSLRREGAELVLELGDDGGGLNFAAIRTKGEEKGLLLPEQPATQEELIALLLRPGFSTATSVTQISGRGVGMDVVNEAIRAMRGALLIQTEPGQGTRFIIRLPFSLAVTQALLVRAGNSTFAIPLLSIELVARLKENEFQAYLSGEPVQHRYSERGYPIHNLGILIGSEQIQPFDEVADRRPPVLLFRSAEASAALQVEAVLGNREIIVKPVGPQFNGVPGISGATVLGDGRVVVVLELAALVRNIGSQSQKQVESRALRMARQEVRQEKINIMVIDDSITMRKVTARILERHNIQVVTAKDGVDAVAMLQTQVPDLAILDIEMPRMDGFEVVAHVRNQQALRGMPIIMVTSRGGEKHRERALKLGVNDYLTKPYQEEQLMQSIRRILGERALELIT
ncbi:MAG TPA: Hpt domain-containing protein [Candidatus Competibacter sp.]|nr:Hpt domain-containing protein [Candidatus Competibacter sp.]